MILRAFTKSFGGKTVLEMPELELEPGKICAVIGANGSGKSTLARVAAGILPPDGGGAVTEGSVGYLPQKSVPFHMSVRANLLVSGGSRERAEQLMERLAIRHLADCRGNRLSGGETARMVLARVLMRPYELVILDEPAASMDVESTLLAERLIGEYCRESGCALLLITHSIQQARRISDEVLFLRGGKLTERGPAARVLDAPDREETRAFLAFSAGET